MFESVGHSATLHLDYCSINQVVSGNCCEKYWNSCQPLFHTRVHSHMDTVFCRQVSKKVVELLRSNSNCCSTITQRIWDMILCFRVCRWTRETTRSCWPRDSSSFGLSPMNLCWMSWAKSEARCGETNTFMQLPLVNLQGKRPENVCPYVKFHGQQRFRVMLMSSPTFKILLYLLISVQSWVCFHVLFPLPALSLSTRV